MSLSCIVPAWNEAPRIARVLDAVAGHPLVAEVVVVDDGSSDGTAAIAAAVPGVRVLRQPNAGKTAAVARGLAAATGDAVMLIDADLTGLTRHDIAALATPVLTGAAGMSISLRGNAPLAWRLLGVDYISGERAFPRALIAPHLGALGGLPRFGLEVFLNRLALSAGTGVRIVPWPGVGSTAKGAKQGTWAGLRGNAAMLRDILATIGPAEMAAQIAGLRRAAEAR